MEMVVDVAAVKMSEYRRSLLILRTQLRSRRYYIALQALEIALTYHGKGFRKDGVTPEMAHQVEMCLFTLTLPDLVDREGHIVVQLGHDTPEDYRVRSADYIARFDEDDQACVAKYAHSMELLNKYNPDRSLKDEKETFELIGRDLYASIAKPVDRFHNLGTMNNTNSDGEPVFPYSKQGRYADFAEENILTVLKIGRKTFPKQVEAYENLKHILNVQIKMVRAILAANASGARKQIAIVER